jgi:hypothetical protein
VGAKSFTGRVSDESAIAGGRLGADGRGVMAALLADLGAEGGREAKEEFGGETLQFASGEDGLDLIQAGGEAGEFLLLRREKASLERLVFEALEVINLSLIFFLPGDEGALGDGEFGGNTLQRPAPRTPFDEALAGFFRMLIHIVRILSE